MYISYQNAQSTFFETDTSNDFNELSREISKFLSSTDDSSLETVEDSEDNYNPILEKAFPNLSPIFCKYHTSSQEIPSSKMQWSLCFPPFSLSKCNSYQRNKTKEYEKNKIYIEKIIAGFDNRTTLMIRHIPNKYTLKSITNEINQQFKNTYDVFYLPMDYNNNCNLGFAFINFIHPMYIVDFYETFKGRRWNHYLSEKRCELAYAKIQGRSNLLVHFEKGVVLNSQPKDKKPLILDVIEPFPMVRLSLHHREQFEHCNPTVPYMVKDSYFYVNTLCM